MSGVVYYSFKDYMIVGVYDVVDEKKFEVIWCDLFSSLILKFSSSKD